MLTKKGAQSKATIATNTTNTSTSPIIQRPPGGASRQQGRRVAILLRLKWIYIWTTTLCVFMVFWILLVPGSWLIGRSQFHNNLVLPHLFNAITPPEIITKYQGHTLVQVTHILPGAVWAGLIPFQLHRTFRSHYRTVHRRMGYLFLTTSLLMSVGLGLILHRGLFFEHHDFPDLVAPLPSRNYYYNYSNTAILMVILGIWFLGTAIAAIYCARSHQFVRHQKWIIRHIASGLWIAIQRVLLMTVCSMVLPRPYARHVQRRAFEYTAKLGMLLSFAIGEYTISLLEKEGKETGQPQQQQQQQQQLSLRQTPSQQRQKQQ
jgi:hypothetical protein